MIRVWLSVASPAFRAGLRSLLATDAEIAVVGEDAAGIDSSMPQYEADVVIMTSASFEPASAGVRKTRPGPAILLLGNDPVGLEQLQAISSATGIIAMDAAATEICAAVRAVAAGLMVGSRALLTATAEIARDHGPLTDREAEVLGLLSRGLANKQIAAELGISEHTVKFHVSSIYAKLNATSRTQAVREGLRNGWIVL